MGLLGRMFGSDETEGEGGGLAGEATIVRLAEGGPYVNDRPTITMVLEVELPGHEAYTAEAKQTVGRLVIGRLAPGASIPVLVDPADPAKVVVDEATMLGRPTPQ